MQPASATDKSTGAAQDLTDQTAGPKASQSGDAKTVEAAKQVLTSKNLCCSRAFATRLHLVLT